MKLSFTQVIGLNTDQKASQTNFTRQDNDNVFTAVLSLDCDDAFTKGRQALSELSDFYFDFDGSPSQKLTATFNQAVKLFSDIPFGLALAAVSGKVLYLISEGDVLVLLKRENNISNLLELSSVRQLISGFLSEGDKVLLTTKSLTKVLGEDLAGTLNLSLEDYEKEVSDKIGTLETSSGELAALLIEVEAETESQMPPLTENYDEGIKKDPENKPKVKSILSFPILSKLPSIKKRFILAFVLISFIVLGIGIKFVSDQNKQKESQFVKLLSQSRDDFNAAKNLQSLNPKEAKLKLDSARQNIEVALNLRPKDSEAKLIKQQIESETDAILQQFHTQNFPEFFDLNLIKENFKANWIFLSGDEMLLLDSGDKSLVTVDLTKKSHQVLSGKSQLGDGLYASLAENMAYVYSKDQGVLRIDTKSQKIVTVSKPDSGWGQIRDVSSFGSNIYLLDNSKNQIWKYLPSASGYSDKREYLTKQTKADFSDAVRMQIDSSVYVLKSNGEILKFTRGSKDNFTIEGLEKSIKDPKSFFVSEDTQDLYILDSGNSRLLITTKTGSYKSQVEGEKFAKATDLVVDEKEKKVYLLEGSKVYSIDLR